MLRTTSHPPEHFNLIVGLSGASGAILGIRLLQVLQGGPVRTHLVLSTAARLTIPQETDWMVEDVLGLAYQVYDPQDTGAAIASGSYPSHAMLIVPCSIKTLSAVANAYTADLMSRAADVTLKEGRPLVLVVREAPLHAGHLRLMQQASAAGAVIFPPVPAFYARPASLNQIVDGIVGRVLARVGIETDLYHHWKDPQNL